MRFHSVTPAMILLALTIGGPAAGAQGAASSPAAETPRFDASVGYNFVRANAPPGSCDCFGLNGGYASADFHVTQWLSFAGEVTGGHANNISGLGQNLTLLSFAGGPRVTLPHHRIQPFGQFLFGGVHGSDSYFPKGLTYTTSASSWAYQTGGGVDIELTHRFAVRAIDAEFLRSALPNGTGSNSQNHLMLGAGLVIKFGRLKHDMPLPPPPPDDEDIAFSCSANATRLDQGETLEILGTTRSHPDRLQVTYTWTASAGTIMGTGREVKLDTSALAPGEYRVSGHASAKSNPRLGADCEVVFQIKTPAETVKEPTVVAPPPPPAPEQAAAVREFHENVKDALFDYDKSDIRPDAQAAILHAAEYLQAHPAMQVQVGGYADERGSAEYNVALGLARAQAARKALIAAGIAPERIEVVSYGKEVQVCSTQDEACYQQNRRAAFNLHP